jgi:peptidoglycan-N-acetylglucosamine deacetylase
MRSIVAAVAACVFAVTAAWAECPADALGTARTITVDPGQLGRIGTMQYRRTLPLNDKEVVLTFDDGPVPPYSNRILDILAEHCVKATFFIVGQQAREFPEVVRRVYDEGHTVATHSEHHPRAFDRLPARRVAEEVDGGLASTATALGEDRAPAPFFRVPGLRTSRVTEAYLASQTIAIWSADVVADDWRHIPAQQVVKRALQRLAAKRKGVLLLHDIQPATALALPDLLKELKARDYRIVHVVPAAEAKLAPPTRLALAAPGQQGWPRILGAAPPQLPVPSPETFGWPDLFTGAIPKPLDGTAHAGAAASPTPVADRQETAAPGTLSALGALTLPPAAPDAVMSAEITSAAAGE